MRILINSSPLLSRKAGIGYYVYNLIERLNSYPQISLQCTFSPSGYKMDSLIKRISDPLKRALKEAYPETVAENVYDFLISPFSAKSRLKLGGSTPKADIYHETSLTLDNEWLINSKIQKNIVNIYDLSALNHPEWHIKSLVDTVQKSFYKMIKADRIITISEYVKSELVEDYGLDESLVTVIPCAPSAAYSSLKESKNDLWKRLLAKTPKIPNKPFILYTGTIEPRKNLKTLIDAYSRVRRKHDLSLILAGGLGWKYDDIVEYPKLLGLQKDIFFTGYLDEESFLLLYNLAQIYVYPSFYEGFGIPPLEAMSCGTPVIVSRAASLPEVVGDGALLFNPNDPEELAYNIELVLESGSLRKRLIERGFTRVQMFNWDKSVERLVRLYEQVLTVVP